MKKESGFFINENGNRWDCLLFTKKQALKYEKSLSNCRDCSNCHNCHNCHNCSDYTENPCCLVSQAIGSPRANTTVYWTSHEDVQVICGCFRGDIAAFKEAVNETHANNVKHLSDYLKFIELAEYAINFKLK